MIYIKVDTKISIPPGTNPYHGRLIFDVADEVGKDRVFTSSRMTMVIGVHSLGDQIPFKLLIGC